jgi:septum formation topological specificity factor MinE
MSEAFNIKERKVVFVGEKGDEGRGTTEIELPRLTLGKIIAVTKAVETLMSSAKEKSPQLFELFTKNKENDNMQVGVELVKLLPSILPTILEEITEVIAIYINKDKEWVKNTMDVEDLVAIATPFFENILSQGSHIVGPLSNLFPKQETLVSQ